MNLMLLCAGEGTRFRPHTMSLPKPALPFLNAPLACYSLALLEAVKVERLIVNTFHLPQKITDLFQKIPLPATVQFSHEKDQIQGSGGGIKGAEKFFDLKQTLIVMNGDEVLLPHQEGLLERALVQHERTEPLATLIVMNHPEIGSKFGGIWCDARGKILDIGKTKPAGATKGFHFIGISLFSGEIFKFLPQGPSHIFTDALLPAIKKGADVRIFEVEAEWYETGNLPDYLKATQAALSILNSRHASTDFLKALLKKYTPKTVLDKKGSALILRDESVVVPADLSVKDFAVLGSQCKLNEKTTLQRCVLNKNVNLATGAYVDQLFL